MEQKHILMSALSVGIGVGIGLASGQTVSKWTGGDDSSSNAITPRIMEQEMLNLIVDGRNSNVTFDEFPYYLSEQTRVLLTSAAFVYLKNFDFSKHTRNLAPASRTILLSGPAELYQQMLAKALAHYFEARLLLLDITDFSLKIQGKYGSANKEYVNFLNSIPTHVFSALYLFSLFLHQMQYCLPQNAGDFEYSTHILRWFILVQTSCLQSFKRSISETTLAQMSSLFGSFSALQPREESKGTLRRQSSGVDIGSWKSKGMPSTLRRNASAAANLNSLMSNSTPTNPAPLKRTSSFSFDEKLFIQTLYKVLVSISKTSPIVLYLRDADKLLYRSQRIYILLQKMLKKLTGPVLILGSQIVDPGGDYIEVDERLNSVFLYNIEIRPPEDETHLVSWKAQLEEDMKMIQYQDTRNHIIEVLAANDLDCDDLGSICSADTMILSRYIEEIVVSAISYHLMNTKDPEYRNGKLVISSASLSRGLSLFQEVKSVRKDTLKLEAQTEVPKEGQGGGTFPKKPETKSESSVPENKSEASAPTVKDVDSSNLATKEPELLPPDNEFEKRIRPEVIPASEIGVTFADIGAMEETKESLQELVMLPLRRPDLFKGGLLKPCRGILLFGPPGTGKTMLAKAIANEAGASFINVSMSTITSKWFGEDEKNVRALFTLAAKVSPTIIFVDEVDSMLGQRSRAGEHEAMRKIKNEFMTHWDGLLTKQGEKILVLAATNRPFDLDEAIIRRFERRILVGLPSVENREMILKTLLAKEKVDKGLHFKELATMTEGYSGSDLKNLCTTAAYRPVRELIQQERLKDREKRNIEGGQKSEATSVSKGTKEDKVINIRPLNMADFREAKTQVAASFAAEGSIMNELKQWNDLYGEGGSRKKEQLSYFL